MFCPTGVAKKCISSWTNTSVQRCLYQLFQNQSPHFLLSPLVWKLSQPSGQDQQSGKQTYCRLPPWSFTIYFYGLLMGLSLQNLCWFFFKHAYSTMVAEKCQIYSIKITGKYICESNNKSVHFYSCSQAKLSPWFLSLSLRQKEIPHSSWTAFSEYIFSWAERLGRELWS